MRSTPRSPRTLLTAGLVVALLAALTLTAKAFAPVPAPVTDSASGAGAMLGAYVRPSAGWSRTSVQDAVGGFESRIGRKLAIDHMFLTGEPAPSSWLWRAAWDLDEGRVPLITLGARLDTVEVASGRHDAFFRSVAESLRSLKAPVFLRYAPEPELAPNRRWSHSGADYVAAWRRVHGLLAGAPAAWVWSPTAGAFAGAAGGVEPWWPGDRYVDWIATSAFNRFGCQSSRWRELREIVQPFYAWAQAKAKPLMLAQVGTAEDPADPARKARWYEHAARDLQTAMPRVKAAVFFDSPHACDWRASSSSAALDGFMRLAHDPWLQLEGTTFTGEVTPGPTSSTATSTSTTGPAPKPTTTTTRPATTTSAPPTTAPPPGGVTGKLVPRSGVLWGSSSVSDGLEAKLGRRFDISHTFQDWDGAFPNAGEQARARNGSILLINWTPRDFQSSRIWSWRSIANGSQDAQIRTTAGRIKAFGKPLFMIFHTEPEPDVGRYGTKEDYVAAWRHIHDRFRAEGVSNVVWVWNVTGSSGWYGLYTGGLYPGDAYVDWISWDPYNWYTCHKSGWISFGDKVAQFYAWLQRNGFGDKPFMLAEYGTRDMPGDATAKAEWYGGIVPALKSRLPNLKAVVYFHNGTANPGCDWRVDTTQTALSAFAKAGKDPFVNPR